MLMSMLLLLIAAIGTVGAYRHWRRRRHRTLLDLIRHAETEDRWVEIVTQAHQTMSANEVQELEQAMYLRSSSTRARPSTHQEGP